ncbi:5'-nucleotidase C-terminal domain-containing protein [Lutibacter citreus]|uniref:5'-nucleotidase C-terminal domain-containing protein n=1 Tax=Lutibacter citreus TaxID=2138210 RepID=UPI000DBE6F5F|nr:5'-nucleotidase C-terminal domain-containing protein [Lutibacter citreus]
MKKYILFFLSIIILNSCKKETQSLVRIEGKLLPITKEIKSVQQIDSFILPYKLKVEKEMNTILSYTKKDLVRTDGILESSLGNLMADMCFERANPIFNSRTGKNIDFALFNYGGIRAGITKGDITTANAFNLMPFENSLVVVELTAKKVNELVQYLIDKHIANPISKHIKLAISDNSYDLKIKNKKLDPAKTYFVLTSNYLQKGGDQMTFFSNPVSINLLDYKVRNAIIDYFSEKDTIYSNLDNRFIQIK